MKHKHSIGILMAGSIAGMINGLLGTGGGMVLIPLLCHWSGLEETIRFPCSVAMILPMCIVSLAITSINTPVPLPLAAPYMIGGAIGGYFAGIYANKIPVVWLHRILGLFILWGGIRFLW